MVDARYAFFAFHHVQVGRFDWCADIYAVAFLVAWGAFVPVFMARGAVLNYENDDHCVSLALSTWYVKLFSDMYLV